MSELPLAGGNASAQVVKVGQTVRKPWLPFTPSTQRFAQHLLQSGVDLPRPLGRDEQGRQSNEFVPGTLAMDAPHLTAQELARVGRMVRSIHDASSTFSPAPTDRWDPLIPAPGHDLVCHNDLAPWNLITGPRWVFIDWDGAAPSTRLWDLAYAAQAFTLNDTTTSPEAAAGRLSAFVKGYDADSSLRRDLPHTMWERAQAMYDMLAAAHATGHEPWGSMFTTGHGAHWAAVTEYVRTNEDLWFEALGNN